MAAVLEPKHCVFVIVPGSFATPALYDENISSSLRAKGHEVRSVELLSANDGTRMPPATMEEDAAHIRAAVTSILDDEASPKDVVIVLHSYSGIPGSSSLQGLGKAERAAQGKITGVTGITYMGAFVPLLDHSVRDIMLDAAPEPYKTGIPGGYLPSIPVDLAALIFNDTSVEDAGRYHAMMTLHSSDSYNGKTSYEAWKDIPSVQIIPERDMIIPPALQEDMHQKAVEAGGKVSRVYVKDAGHAVNVSQTELVVNEIIKLAQGESNS